MFKFFCALILILLSDVSIAGEVVRLGVTSSDEWANAAQSFIESRDFSTQEKRLSALKAMNPHGLSYIDDALKILRNNSWIWSGKNDKGPVLLATLPGAASQIDTLGRHYLESNQHVSIHDSAQFLLKKYGQNNPEVRANVVSLYNKLFLWEESDASELTTEYFTNREMAGTLINVILNASQNVQKEFARRVRTRYDNRQFIELMILYKTEQSIYNLTTTLLYLLMRDADFRSRHPHNPDSLRFGTNWRAVPSLRNEVLMDLHRRLVNRDQEVMDAYDRVYSGIGASELEVSNPQKKEFYKFMRELRTGPDQCKIHLDVIESDPEDEPPPLAG